MMIKGITSDDATLNKRPGGVHAARCASCYCCWAGVVCTTTAAAASAAGSVCWFAVALLEGDVPNCVGFHRKSRAFLGGKIL